ncbi:chemotaxis protein CheA [Denitratisoma oestradiolicum]|uniref:Chemotaxis protein CheA n=1 Tax=Denitratisoma oestradiolicum TaxID=311182 RepID=A0A6S6YNU4_9PROT|nr:chemotaxis protein CheA [Denitratisoma oestradiolicum]TWO79055.1 chemotaxis protein CheA [Denitratisoma oestradiolicum]CAB1369428.1 Chemotaxis protein CheA [Denitratisoma oestradiolicum]
MDELHSVFAQESREQLTEMEAGLLGMEQGDHDAETINSIFRAAHTIKGASGVVELHQIEGFTHVMENALDKLRNGEIQVSSELITALLRCCDHLGALLTRVEEGNLEPAEELQGAGDLIAEALRNLIGENADGAGLPETQAAEVERDGEGAAMNDCWHLSVRFGRNVLRNGMEPMAFLRYLLSLGEIVHMATITDAIPPAEEMDPESCYLGFEINFRSHADKAAIERVFEFVRDDCDLHILPPHSKLDDFLHLIETLPEENLRIGEILVRCGALTQEELDQGLRRQKAADVLGQKMAEQEGEPPPPPTHLGEILVKQHVVHPEVVEAAAARQKQVSDKKAADARLIRVHADKLDQLIDLVGELVIAGASANLLAQKSGQTALVETTSVLSRLVESIRDSALQLRMVQIGETFNRFQRVVRDVSKELGKDIDLVISGAETELDKSVVEKIGDPLMHLVRNAMDHGIEPAELRASRGKPVKGRVELNAFHDSGSIVIEVADDGGGLNQEKIRAKAIERGLIQESDSLSEQDIVNLIFEAGFSTMDKVSNLSGRGVGMDVVKKNITALRGTVDVKTELGTGSRFIIRLPLTLAIIDGFLTGVSNSSYVIPLDMVVECIELADTSSGRNYLNLRGEVLPFVRLRDLFEVPGNPPQRENVVVVQYAGRKAGIVVDQLLGEFQTVIKPLGTLFRNIRGIGGSTILGSGEVALILDVQALISRCSRAEELAQGNPGSRQIETHSI